MNISKKQKNRVPKSNLLHTYDLEHLRLAYEKLCLEYAYASGIASKSGLNLQIYGKRVKPYLKKQMQDIEQFQQLELAL